MPGDDAGDDAGEVNQGLDAGHLGVSISDATTAQYRAPPSDPAKSAFFRVRASGQMELSTTLESISTRPSSRNRLSPAQRESP
jgi:hypothetical protein